MGCVAGIARAEPDDDAPADDAWDADKAHARFVDTIVVTAHGLRRAVWLRRLADAVVAWGTQGGDLRFVRLTGGIVTEAGNARSQRELRRPARPTPRRLLLRSMDVAAYDRLRVLATEIRSVVMSGGDVIVATAGRSWTGVRLRGAVAWS